MVKVIGDMDTLTCRVQFVNDLDPFECISLFPEPPRAPMFTFNINLPLDTQIPSIHHLLKAPHKLDESTLQLYRDGDYGPYLDLEASINEQEKEFDSFLNSRKNSIVLRSRLSVRVNGVIEKLLTAEGRELRRALFSLKQVFQEDKDLVHEFVENDGLSCLVKVGTEADHNHQNYILRALGQLLLYVDGMYGVMRHNETIQWLYTLVTSRFRLVQKTALKLLLVFVDYVETNCLLLVEAISSVDSGKATPPWSHVMNLLQEYDFGDTELVVYGMTLVNKVLNGIPDIDTYYDQVDALEEQGIAGVIQKYMGKQCVDLDLLQQLQIYEVVLKHEDGEEDVIFQLDETMREKVMNRKGYIEPPGIQKEVRRKSRRFSYHSNPSPPPTPTGVGGSSFTDNSLRDSDEWSSSDVSSTHSASPAPSVTGSVILSPLILNGIDYRAPQLKKFDIDPPHPSPSCQLGSSPVFKRDVATPEVKIKPWTFPVYPTPVSTPRPPDVVHVTIETPDLCKLQRQNTVKGLTRQLTNQGVTCLPEEKVVSRVGDLSGIISKAKEGLAKSKSKEIKTTLPIPSHVTGHEGNQSENEVQWDQLMTTMRRPLKICDLDFTDLGIEDDLEVISTQRSHLSTLTLRGTTPMGAGPPPPPLLSAMKFPSAPKNPPVPPTPFELSLKSCSILNSTDLGSKRSMKSKKTVKLFWKEVREDPVTMVKVKGIGSIWDELQPVMLDTQKLEYLFESRAKDVVSKKPQDVNKCREVVVLDPKRSNAINIGMTKLPPPRTIKTAILKMDSTIINREGIEKLLTMLPTDEEKAKIQEAQFANPDTPLGSAEQFLLMLSSISELTARLKLWAFKLDYENLEKEIGEPLMDLKLGIESLQTNKTFRCILNTLLCIGNFLNGGDAKGFQIDYLAKLPEVKDTVYKHSLLHHLCQTVNEKFPESTDLYSEIGPVTRASRVDFDVLSGNLTKIEFDCKASGDYLRVIGEQDGSTSIKLKMSEFLADCSERIVVLGLIHHRLMNRYQKFVLWLGTPCHLVPTTKPHHIFKIVSEFALEYRTTRERVIVQAQKKANQRDRHKTRGKLITEEVERAKGNPGDAELREVLKISTEPGELGLGLAHFPLTGTGPRRSKIPYNTSFSPNKASTLSRLGNLGGGDLDQEILDSLVKTATSTPTSRVGPRERKRNMTRFPERKSLRRTLRHGLTDEERILLGSLVTVGDSITTEKTRVSRPIQY